MSDRNGIFAGDDPIDIVRRWLNEAEKVEPNDPNAMSLATVDTNGMPNVRVVLLKEIEDNGFVFFTNYNSAKSQELKESGTAAFVIHWKSLRRQVRVRGVVSTAGERQADEYYLTRSLKSRLGAWASQQSEILQSREQLMDALSNVAEKYGENPPRPPHWGGFCIKPLEIELWADGEARLHDRFVWKRKDDESPWFINRLNP